MNPTSKLADTNNTEQPQFSFQRKEIENFRTPEVPEGQAPHPLIESSPLNDLTVQSDNSAAGPKPKRSFSAVIDVDNVDDNDSDYGAQPRPSKISFLLFHTCS